MALITRSALASMDVSTGMIAPQVTGLKAGENLDQAAPCYIDTDGLVYMSNATAVDKEAQIAGFTPKSYLLGEPVTLFGIGARFRYGSGLTPGAILYLGATNGRLDGAATTGDAVGCARVVTATDIVVIRANPELAASSAISGNNVGNVANANVVGGIPVIFRIDIADAATGDVDVVSTHKVRVIDAWAVKTANAGGAANTIQVKNGANAITDAMSININDQAIVRAASIDDAQHEIAAGGTLKVTRTKAGGNAACIVYVSALRVA